MWFYEAVDCKHQDACRVWFQDEFQEVFKNAMMGFHGCVTRRYVRNGGVYGLRPCRLQRVQYNFSLTKNGITSVHVLAEHL